VGEGRILVAARVGTTRLIDNMPITFDRITADASPAGTATAASTTP
jgi:pantoate--beta-alanine ligase